MSTPQNDPPQASVLHSVREFVKRDWDRTKHDLEDLKHGIEEARHPTETQPGKPVKLKDYKPQGPARESPHGWTLHDPHSSTSSGHREN